MENHNGLMSTGHSNKRILSSLNVSQNLFNAMRIKLLPNKAGVLAFHPLESNKGTVSFLT